MKLLRLTTFAALAVSSLISQPVFADSPVASSANNALTEGQITQIKSLVHDYLVTNPQVLVEASQSLQQQEMKKMADSAKTGITANAKELFANQADPVGGDVKGDVTLIEFFDYQCPHCKDISPVIQKLIAGDSKLRVVYKQLPIFGQTSKDAAAIALASLKQGREAFLKLNEALLAAENPLSKDKALQIAKSLGLDTTKLEKDMSSDDVQKQIAQNLSLAQTLNLMGTPTFIVAKWQVDGKNNHVENAAFMPGMPTLEELQSKIAAARQAK